jgi:hypothetical protein
MSSPILPVQGARGTSSPIRSRDADVNDQAFVAELSASDRVLAIEAGRGGPPAEVLDQIATASRISEKLSEDGIHPRFSTRRGQRVAIEFLDTEKNSVSNVSVAEALEIAVGRPLG